VSAPASLAVRLLEDCQSKLSGLSSRVADLSKECSQLREPSTLKSRSLSNLPSLSTPSAMGDDGEADNLEGGGVEKPKVKKARRCHQCHTPLGE
jgi:hypothetical protein